MTYTIVSDGTELSSVWTNPKHSSRAELKKCLRSYIEIMCSNGDAKFYVNCEDGVPLWAAEIICEMKKTCSAELHIVMPYEEQAAEWSEKKRKRYFSVHKHADSVVMASTHYHDSCYNKADEIMIRKSAILVVFATDPYELYAVKYAEKCGHPSISFC